MDFMKVFDQTVREIKREVNLKVLKVPEMEQKVLDATDDEPWGPHGSALSEIAQATKKFSECQMIMNVLWTRLTEGSARWRHAYKALTVIEYLIANGSERAVDDILEHSSQISVLSKFEYVEPNGKDTGINVRKKVETIINLINDKDKIKTVRDKAASNRDKYVGLSSSGITFKSSATSSYSSGGSYNNNSSDRYGTLTGTRDSYKDKEDTFGTKQKKKSSDSGTSKIKKGTRNQDSGSKASSKTPNVPINDDNNDDNDGFDDFDPRGSSTSGATNNNNSNINNNANPKAEVDLFGPNLMDDFLDIDSKPIEEKSDDLFADADFQSAPIPRKPQDPLDLFGQVSSKTPDLFTTPEPNINLNSKPNPISNDPFDPFDPFAAIPMSNFDSDPFGDFKSTSAKNTVSKNETLDSLNSLVQDAKLDDDFGTFTSAGTGVNTGTGIGAGTGTGIKTGTSKSGFQVKSDIWADSLSKGLIDLNITAPKKVNLSDIGIVGGLDDANNENNKFPSYYMNPTGGSSNLFGQNQFGNFK